MKKNLKSLLLVAGMLLAAAASHAQSATVQVLQDGGGQPLTPVPGPDDQSQLNTPIASGSPPGLNYYVDNGNAPGQTFTTGSNAQGYVLDRLALFDADSTGGNFGEETFTLNLYQVSGTNATLYASYTSQSVLLQDFYWFEWSGFNHLPLLPNTQYAFALHRNGPGWMNLGNVAGDTYVNPAGQAVSIPLAGGALNPGTATDSDASFNVALTPATNVVVGPLQLAPGNAVTNGTPVTITAPVVVGGGPYHYQWQMDGGGDTLTNIPGGTSATLPVNTTGWNPGVYHFALVVTNDAGLAGTNTVTLGVYQQSPGLLTDVGTSIQPGTYDLSQLTGGGTADGLNYYDDNNPPPGQTFTTGANAQGYYLNSVTVGTGAQDAGTSGHTGSLKPYTLQIYQVEHGNAAVLIASYTNASFSFTFGDWLAWSGFPPLWLKANTTYAYTFHLWPTAEGGWAAMSIASNNPYADGQACVIPLTGGAITYNNSGAADAAFAVGLTPVGIAPTTPNVGAITAAPGRNVATGTAVTLAVTASGATPLAYQWRTDGGTGGALTNIPAASATNLMADTTGWTPGQQHQFAVVVSNNYGTVTSAVVTVATFYPATNVLVTDLGPNVPTPAPGDLAQATPASGFNSPDGMNYYYNNDAPPGQTFTTGNHPGGYQLNTLAIGLAGNGNLVAQTYVLRIYAIAGGNATLYATYNSQDNFALSTDTDAMQWTGLALPLAPNTTYAYTLYGGQGWDNLANVAGNPYAGGEVCLIPPGGGAVSYGSSHDYDGVFVLGLTLPGYPVVAAPTFAPSRTVYAGTPVTASASASGSGPFTYQWQAADGLGGYTNVPGATGATLAINTTGQDGLTREYGLVAGNGSGMTTGQVATLTILPAQAPMFVSDITNSLYQLPYQVTTFVGGAITFSATNVQGTLPVTYQWQADGGTLTFTNIPAATNDTLTLSGLKVSSSGNYQLLASNYLGMAQTSYSTLTVLPQPANPFIANFQFHTYVNADVGNYAGPGIIGTGTYWNQAYGPANFPSPGGVFTSDPGYSEDGSVNCGVSWTVMANNTWGWTATPTIALLDSAANAYTPDVGKFLFTLPNGLYNLVLYSCNGTEAGNPNQIRPATFTVNGVSRTVLPTTDQQFLLNTNCLVFSNVVVRDAALTGTWSSTNGFGSLNGAQIQYLGNYQPLTLQPTNGMLKLEWLGGTLLQATNVAGPWTTNPATSPYLVAPTESKQFFRLQTQ